MIVSKKMLKLIGWCIKLAKVTVAVGLVPVGPVIQKWGWITAIEILAGCLASIS